MTRPPLEPPTPRHNLRFSRVRFREAYNIVEVDEFFDRAHDALDSRDGSITVDEVESVLFRPERWKEGYDMGEVDEELDRIAAALQRLERQDLRDLLEQVISNVVGEQAHVEWLAPEGWSAHARLQSASGQVGYLLSSPEWQEARFEDPRCSTFLITDGDDEDDVRRALERLARAVTAYLSGHHQVENKRGLLGTRTTLVLHTEDGLWRIGKRTTQPPRFSD
jgi:DivIVA domain-containing protein